MAGNVNKLDKKNNGKYPTEDKKKSSQIPEKRIAFASGFILIAGRSCCQGCWG